MRAGLEPGTLWPRVRAVTDRALASGALRPIETTSRLVEEGGVAFSVRVVEALARKDAVVRRALSAEGREAGPTARPDPFLPHEAELFVAALPPGHKILLNKFPVLRGHALIVTGDFQHQEELLTLADVEALCACLVEGEALGFYNGGEVAGASQPHKHLQLVPLPIDEATPRLPIEPLLEGAPVGEGGFGRAEGLPFEHALARFDSGPPSAEALHALHLEMLLELGVAPRGPVAAGARQLRPYNLLVTSRWMLAVPRSAEFCEGVSVNAVGFAGGLLVRTGEQAARVAEVGPMSILRGVALPREGGP